jgi:hypothetical protein
VAGNEPPEQAGYYRPRDYTFWGSLAEAPSLSL